MATDLSCSSSEEKLDKEAELLRIGINGFGRVGRLVLRLGLDTGLQVVAINDPYMSAETMAYLLKYDSVHKRFQGTIEYKDEGTIVVNENEIKIYHEVEPELIPWAKADVQYVLECSGHFICGIEAGRHLKTKTVEKVIIAGPSPDVPMFVMGVNNTEYRTDMVIISCASSTTNALAVLLDTLHQGFIIQEAMVTVLYANTNQQKVVDANHKPKQLMREGRASGYNVIPTLTGAPRAVQKILPVLTGKVEGMAMRIPILDVSLIDVTVSFENQVEFSDLTNMLIETSNTPPLKGILTATNEQVVSSDFIGDPHSCIVDLDACIQLNPTFIKFIAWFDNEIAYVHRLIDLVHYVHDTDVKAMRSSRYFILREDD